MPRELPESVRIAEVSRELGLSASRIRQLADSGVIPCGRTSGGHRLFDLDAVRAALARSRLARAEAAGAATEPTWQRRFTLLGPAEHEVWRRAADDLGLDVHSPAGRIMAYAFQPADAEQRDRPLPQRDSHPFGGGSTSSSGPSTSPTRASASTPTFGTDCSRRMSSKPCRNCPRASGRRIQLVIPAKGSSSPRGWSTSSACPRRGSAGRWTTCEATRRSAPRASPWAPRSSAGSTLEPIGCSRRYSASSPRIMRSSGPARWSSCSRLAPSSSPVVRHVGTRVIPVNMNPAVDFMVRRGLRRTEA